jgi:hypothetical protein
LAIFFSFSPAVLKSDADVGGQLAEFDGPARFVAGSHQFSWKWL